MQTLNQSKISVVEDRWITHQSEGYTITAPCFIARYTDETKKTKNFTAYADTRENALSALKSLWEGAE